MIKSATLKTHTLNLLIQFYKNYHYFFKMAFIAILYYFSARGSLTLAFEGSSASPVWPPSGIALAAMFLMGFRAAPAILLGAFAANLMQFYLGHAGISQISLLVSLSIAVGNTLEALIALYLARQWLRHEIPFTQPLNIFKFTLVILLACAAAATIGSTSLLMGKLIPVTILFPVWLNWWLGDVAGVVVLTPLVLTWLPLRKFNFSAQKLSECIFTGLLVLFVSWLIFSGTFSANHQDRLLVYLAILVLAWVAYRFRLRGVTLTTLLLSSAAVYATIKGLGPFNNGDLNDSLILLVSFISMFSLTGLLLAADLFGRSLPESTKSNKPNLAWFTLVGLLGLTIIAWHITALDTEKNATKQFQASVQQIESLIKNRMKIYEEVLQGGVALFTASSNVTKDEWHSYYQTLDLQTKFPGILGFGFAKYLNSHEVIDFINSEKKERDHSFLIQPNGDRDFYGVTQYLEPEDTRNRKTIGFDMYSEGVRHAAMKAAMETGSPKITGKISLLYETDASKRMGILMYLPVYRNDVKTETVAQRKQAISGFVYAPFRLTDLMSGILGAEFDQIGFTIFDGTSQLPKDIIYSSTSNNKQTKAPSTLHSFSEFTQIEIAGRQWRLHFFSLPQFENSIDRQKAQLVLLAGFLISILLFIMVRALTVSKETALALAKQMTSALKNSEAKFRSMAESANEAILVTDAQGSIVSWNHAAFNIFGYADADILHQHLSKIFPDYQNIFPKVNDNRAINSTVLKASAETIESIGLSSDGKNFPIEISFSHWLSDEGLYFSAIIRDISERKLAEAELQTSEKRFRSMMEHAPIGMALVSLTGQWMQINDALSNILGYSQDELITKTFQDITYAEDLANDLEHLTRLISNEITDYKIEKRYIHKNGSVIWAMLSVSLLRDEYSKPLYFISQIENINDQKLAQIQLNETLAFRSAILASADQLMISTNTEGLIMSFNRAAEEKLGYTQAELVGIYTPALFHLQEEVITRAEELTNELGFNVEPGFDVFILKAQQGDADEREWTYRCKDGSTFPIILSVTAVTNTEGTITGYLGVASDITERKLSEQALLAESKYLTSVIEGTNAGTWQWHVKTNECRFNNIWANMMGYQLTELGEQTFSIWEKQMHPEDNLLVKQKLAEHIDGKAPFFEAEFRMHHKNGDWIWVLARGRLLNQQDTIDNDWMYGTLMDISERKRIDLELRQAYSNLEEFTAIASHDLKTPLRGIADLSEWIEEDLGDQIAEDIKNNLNRIKIRVRRMDALITELLEYARASVSSDQHILVDPVAMIHDIIELQSIPPTFKVSVSGSITPFTTSATPLETIVRNLISNAVKHHDRADGKIEIKLYAKNNFNVFEISDDGPGIPKAAQERVFKLFQTLSKSETSSGVGLAVSRRMAEAHGGAISLESSTEKHRTTFTVLWPSN